MTTPTVREDPTRLDNLPWPEVVRRAWTDPDLYPDRYAHEAMRITIRGCAPELARALDRAAAEPERQPRPVPWQEPGGLDSWDF